MYSPRCSPVQRERGSTGEDAMEVEEMGVGAREGGRPKAYLVAYNVFVLTDPIGVLAQKAPWLVNRVPGGSGSGSGSESRSWSSPSLALERPPHAPPPIAPTNADGSSNEHVVGEQQVSGSGSGSRSGEEGSYGMGMGVEAIQPEIDFAQRERDEMRELTKATEILGGCVFLGNASDVPIPSTSRSRPPRPLLLPHPCSR